MGKERINRAIQKAAEIADNGDSDNETANFTTAANYVMLRALLKEVAELHEKIDSLK